MYEQSLDLESFQSYLHQHTENEAKFYDDFFNIAATHDWKASKRLQGLPTPPMTPDKSRFQFETSQNVQQQQYHQTSGNYF